MADTTNPSRLALDVNLRVMLPVGISQGWSPNFQRFVVYLNGSSCCLDREGGELWEDAWGILDPDVLIKQLSDKWKRPPKEICSDLKPLFDHKLLIQLTGDWRDDWLRLAPLRVIPRGVLAGQSKGGVRDLLLNVGAKENRFDAESNCLCSFWDGNHTLEQSIILASDSRSVPRRAFQVRAHFMLITLMRSMSLCIDL